MPDRNINEIFTENLKYLMNSGDITYTDLAKLLGVSRSTISMWITGKSLPRMDLLDSIADLFGIPVSELMKDHSKPEEVKYIDKNEKLASATGFLHALNYNDFLKYYSYINQENFTKEELEDLRKFAEFIKSKRNTQNHSEPDTPTESDQSPTPDVNTPDT